MRPDEQAPHPGINPLIRRLAVLPCLAIGVALAASACIAMPREGHLAPIWIANALVLAVLLRSEPARWPELIAAAAFGNSCASGLAGIPPSAIFILTLSNVVEYTLVAVALHRLLGREFSVERGRDLFLLGLAAVGCGIISGVLQSSALWSVLGYPMGASLRTWTIAHPMGLLLATPCILAISRAPALLAKQPLTWAGAGSLMALLVASVLVFAQSRYPLLFIVFPVLAWTSLTLGVLGGAVGVMIVASVAIVGTLMHLGPIMLVRGDVVERGAVLQLFLATGFFTSLPVAALQARRRRAALELQTEAAKARLAEAAAARSEAYYRQMTEAASDAIGTIDLKGVVTYASPATSAITGYRPDELVGRVFRENVDPAHMAAVQANFRAIISGAKAAGTPIEYRFRHRSGRWIWLQANPKLVHDDAGQPIGAVDVIRDVTSAKQMEMALEQARAAAEASARVKAEFLANMSHELRTPLTAIIGFGALVAEDASLTAATRRHVERVQMASSALLATVNDVLDFSKLETGQLEICRWPKSPGEVVSEVVDLLSDQARQKGLGLNVEGLDRLPKLVELDADRFRQILVNLVNNAVKFTSQGTVTVTARYDGGHLRVEVTDTGGGIPADRLSLLFQRFSQVDGSSTRRHGGSGLGLAICKGLVEAMDGEIGVESREGEGSRFWFRLPASLAFEDESDAPELEPPDRQASEGARILVMDDNVINRELVGLILRPKGYDITSAENGEEGLAIASAVPFDLLLIDRHMPGLSGEQVAQHVRARGGPNAEAVLVAFSADVLADMPAAFDGMIAKPVTPVSLVEAVEHFLRAGHGRGGLFREAVHAVG